MEDSLSVINYFTFIALKYKQLIKGQRYQIQVLLQMNISKKEIATLVGVHVSTIYREINRNTGKRVYKADRAQDLSDLRKERFGRNRRFNSSMEKLIRAKIRKEQWSPEQIHGHCKSKGIEMVSIERIYQFIRKDKAGGGDLWIHTRHQLKHRKRRSDEKKISIKNRVSIRERPEVVEKKERIGDWETDTIIGSNQKGAILTITERKTGFLLMKKLQAGKHAKELARDMIRLLIPYKHAVHTITSDNGTEFAEHEHIAKKLKIGFYFADPYSSWQRGLNENTNGLIRQYIPKGTNFDKYDDEYIRLVQNKINRRPRKRLNYKSPSEVFYASLS